MGQSRDGSENPQNMEAANASQQQVWLALNEGKPHPGLKSLIERAVTPLEVYYLLERYGTLTIYDAFNLATPGVKIPLALPNVNKHFTIYDCGSSLVAAPNDLFTHERTLADGLQAVEVMVAEAVNRNWRVVDLVGYEKYRHAAWVALDVLSLQVGRSVDVLNFTASVKDHQIAKDKRLSVNAGLRLD